MRRRSNRRAERHPPPSLPRWARRVQPCRSPLSAATTITATGAAVRAVVLLLYDDARRPAMMLCWLQLQLRCRWNSGVSSTATTATPANRISPGRSMLKHGLVRSLRSSFLVLDVQLLFSDLRFKTPVSPFCRPLLASSPSLSLRLLHPAASLLWGPARSSTHPTPPADIRSSPCCMARL
jgi:hypothetical protein